MIAILGGSGLDRWPQLGRLTPEPVDTPYGPAKLAISAYISSLFI